jgi:hypothetical protein
LRGVVAVFFYFIFGSVPALRFDLTLLVCGLRKLGL